MSSLFILVQIIYGTEKEKDYWKEDLEREGEHKREGSMNKTRERRKAK